MLIPGQCPPVGVVAEPVEPDALEVPELPVEPELVEPELVEPELVDAEFWVLAVEELAA